jgi:DNA replication protein DnaC
MGQSGAGKTHLSMAIVNGLMQKKKVSAIYFPFREKMTELKQSVTEKGPYRELMDKFKKAQLLMIDDLFYGRVSSADLNPMYELVNYRYLNNLPMIISTEKTMEKLFSYDEALASRIYERTHSHQIEIIGAEFNYRRRERK